MQWRRQWIGEGNGTTLQCSCLENPRDGEAWWAAVYGRGSLVGCRLWRRTESDTTEVTQQQQQHGVQSMQMVTTAMKLKDAYSLEEKL